MQKIKASELKLKNIPKAVSDAAFVCREAKKILKNTLGVDLVKGVQVVSYSDGLLKMATKGSMYAQEVKMREGQIIGDLLKVTKIKKNISIRFTHINEEIDYNIE